MQYNYPKKSNDKNAESLKDLKKRIKDKDFSGVYIFYGEEEYLKRYYFSLLLKAIGDTIFSFQTIDSYNFDLSSFVTTVQTMPSQENDDFMFSDEESGDEKAKSSANKKLIKVLCPSFSDFTSNDETLLVNCLQELSPLTTVVFYFYNEPAYNSSFFSKGIMKKISSISLLCEFEKQPENSATIKKWVFKHFIESKINISDSILNYFCTCVGNDMSILQNEIQKVSSFVLQENRNEITSDDIDKVCIKTDEVQIFDISNNALAGNTNKALSALFQLKEKKIEWLLIFGTVSKAITDMCNTEYYLKKGCPYSEISQKTQLKEYPIKKYHAILQERDKFTSSKIKYSRYAANLCEIYDDRLKSSKTDNYDLLYEFIFRLSAFL